MEPQRTGPGDCLPKTQGYAKSEDDVYGLTPARLNGGRNYNGPKVAKFLVG